MQRLTVQARPFLRVPPPNENAPFYLSSLPSLTLCKGSISPPFLVHFSLLGRILHFLIFFVVLFKWRVPLLGSGNGRAWVARHPVQVRKRVTRMSSVGRENACTGCDFPHCAGTLGASAREPTKVWERRGRKIFCTTLA